MFSRVTLLNRLCVNETSVSLSHEIVADEGVRAVQFLQQRLIFDHIVKGQRISVQRIGDVGCSVESQDVQRPTPQSGKACGLVADA